ncbi:hypothetical protein C8R45DRAFT_935455 [Mycena sanguinolenta]|nr:hypothetical protein C8R45DRAFT_935455 [Mycena sanguinolenta]
MASLPPELIESIVEHVPDEKSLLACALRASSFLNASQARIFHSISLVHDTAYERLAGILAQSPRLGQYVRLLTLDIEGIPRDWSALGVIQSSMTRVERLAIQGTVKVLVQKQLLRHPSLTGFLSLESLRCVALVKLENVPSSIVTTLLDTCVEVRLFQMSIILEEDEVLRAFPTSHPTRHLEVSEATGAITAFLALPRQLDNLRSLTKLNLSDGVPLGPLHLNVVGCERQIPRENPPSNESRRREGTWRKRSLLHESKMAVDTRHTGEEPHTMKGILQFTKSRGTEAICGI